MQAEREVVEVEAKVLDLPPVIGLDPEQINLVRVVNPFDARDHVRELVPHRRAMTLADLFPAGVQDHVVAHNGRLVPATDWLITYLDPGDQVVVAPVPQKGGFKKILGVVAMLAVSVFAPVLAGSIAGALGITSAMGTAMLTVGLTLAGSYLVHSIFAPSKPSADNSALTGASNESSPTYGIDGAKNTSIEGLPVPVCYGTFRMAGNIIGLHTENVGDTQDLFVLLNAGEGPVQGFSDIRINDNPYTDYPNVTIDTRLGQNAQGVIPWFNATIVPQNVGSKLAADGSWTPYTTQTEVDRIRVDLVASQGIYNTNKSTGEATEYSVPIEVQVSRQGTGVWTTISRSDGGASEFRGQSRSPVRHSWDSGKLAVADTYEVRIRRGSYEGGATGPGQPTNDYIGDKIYIADVNEIITDPMTYPNTALVALKMRLGEQLSSMPQITYLNHGKIINVWSGSGWTQTNSSNPAWIVWDILTNTLYGAGMATSRLDLASFKRWADHCTANNLTWNGPLDVDTNVWDATQYVLRVGRAQLVNIGTRWSVVVEAAQTPTQMFGVANMVKGSYQESWLPMNDRANEVDVTYFDKDDDYKRHTLKVYDPAALAAGHAPKSASITLYGVVNYDQAFREGMFMLNLNRYILKTVSFAAPTEAIACTVGDLIYVQHDMPAYAESGRAAAGSTTTQLQLDKPVLMEDGKSYRVLVKHDSLVRASGTISSIVGNTVSLTGWAGAVTVHRLVSGGADHQVLSQGSGWVQLDSVSGLVVGATYALHETEVIEERSVITQAGERTDLLLVSAFSAAPAQFAVWMFGESTKLKQVFRIKSLSRSSQDGTRQITALQYDPLIYDYTRFGSQFSTGTIDLSKAPIGQVRFPQVYEETFISGSQIRTVATVAWQPPLTGRYAGADVYYRINGGAVNRRTANLGYSHSIDAGRGARVWFKVVAFDIFGNRVAYAGAPEVEYTVIGALTGIDVGQVSAPDVVWNGRDCRLTWRYNSRTNSYEFGAEPDSVGADAGAMDPHFKDYEIRVWHGNSVAITGTESPKRIEYTTQPNYTYTYEKNANDGLSRSLVFEIRMRDIFNNLGSPVQIVAANTAPRILSLSTTTNFEAAQVFVEPSADADFAGVVIWVAEDPEQIAGDIYDSAHMNQFVKYNGLDKVAYLTGLMPQTQYFMRAVAYDVFGFTELLPSAVLGFATTVMDINAIAKGVLDESVLVPALAERINLIDGPADLEGSVANLIEREATLRQEADALLETKVTEINGSKLAEIEAAIALEQTTRVTEDAALAQQIDTVTTTVDGQTATLQTVSSSVDGLAVQYTVKIDNNGYVSGFGLASTPVNGVPTSEFIVRADKFAVIMPGSGTSFDHPFTIGAVNGVNRVIIKSALIGDATINTAKIVDGAITNAKIGNVIQSSNYIQNSSGWIITKTGNAEFNGNVIMDRADIRRRVVIQSGSFDPDQTVIGYTQTTYYQGDSGSPYTADQPLPAGSSIHLPVRGVVITGVVDGNATSQTYNQPYRVACWVPAGGSITINGANGFCSVDLAVFGEMVPVISFSTVNNWLPWGTMMIKFTLVVYLREGQFSSFRFPTFNWAIYKI